MAQVEIYISPADIERVLREWERLHPGKSAEHDLTGKEFADLIVAEVFARATINALETKP